MFEVMARPDQLRRPLERLEALIAPRDSALAIVLAGEMQVIGAPRLSLPGNRVSVL